MREQLRVQLTPAGTRAAAVEAARGGPRRRRGIIRGVLSRERPSGTLPGDSRAASVALPNFTRLAIESSGGAPSMSHFFAYLSRMKFIKRWGLMHNTYAENVQEHSLRVAQIAHALALIRNRKFGGSVSPERVAVLALYHDAGEVLTGDLPSPIKYFNPEIQKAYHRHRSFRRRRGSSRWCRRSSPTTIGRSWCRIPPTPSTWSSSRRRTSSAPTSSVSRKWRRETRNSPKRSRRSSAPFGSIDLPEVRYFLEVFVPSFRLTLDELG